MLLDIPRIKAGKIVQRQIQAVVRRLPDVHCDLLAIQDERRKAEAYLVEEFAADGGKAFVLTKPNLERYSVFIADRGHSTCSCWGGIRYGNCKHIRALAEKVAGNLVEEVES